MRSRRRAHRALMRVPRWLGREVRLWAAAVSGTRAARRRRRLAEAETDLLVPLSPHVGRPGARHAAAYREFTLRGLQRRAITSFGILLIAAVVGGLTGAVLVWDDGRVGPQVVPAENSLPPSHSPGTPDPTAATDAEKRRGVPPAGRDGRADGRTRGARSSWMAGSGAAQPGGGVPDGSASASASTGTPSTSAGTSGSVTQEPTATPTPTESSTSEPTPTPSDSTAITGPQTDDGDVAGQTADAAPALP
jgi:hypothetical protein